MLPHEEVPNMIASPRFPGLTQWLLAFLAVGVWGLLLKPYRPLAFAEAKAAAPPGVGRIRHADRAAHQCDRCQRQAALSNCQQCTLPRRRDPREGVPAQHP